MGIRRRLAPLVDNNRRRIELLNSLLLSFPGTPILYYGDEIGMGDNIYLGDRNGVRTPMQWTSDRNAGFSRCDPARLYFPVIMDPIYGYQVVNVEAQLSDQSSLLHWTRNMIALRKLFQVFGRGSLTFLNPANRKVLAYLRDMERTDGSHETVLCVANLSRFAQPVSLDLALFSGMEPVEMLGYVPFPTITEEPYSLTLAPYSFLWLELQPAREAAEMPPEPLMDAADTFAAEPVPTHDLTRGWSEWLAGPGSALLATVLPEWLPRQRWFGAKTQTIQSVRIFDWVELPAGASGDNAAHRASEPASAVVPPALLFVEIQYAAGGKDLYQLPLAISMAASEQAIAEQHPQSVLARLDLPNGEAMLHDATVREDARQAFLALIENNSTLGLLAKTLSDAAETATAEALDVSSANQDSSQRSNRDRSGVEPPEAEVVPVRAAPVPLSAQPGEAAAPPRSTAPAPSAAQRMQLRESPSAGNPAPSGGRLDAHASSLLKEMGPTTHAASRVGTAEQSNTSILYGQKLILKLFRRLQPGENPDVEIGRFLTEVAKFKHIAPFMGETTMTPAAGEATTTAMLQGLVTNEGDGWEWFLGQLAGFFEAVGTRSAPGEPPRPTLLNLPKPDATMRALCGSALDAAALLGTRTAEMHLALATQTQDQAFCAESFDQSNLEQDARRIETQLGHVIETLKSKLATLDDTTTDLAVQLLSRRHKLVGRAHDLMRLKTAGQRIRIHGDYHLGQTLRTFSQDKDSAALETERGTGPGSGDFVILDFEGEPARTLAERRQKQSPLKDVAGMIRSFSYAASAGLERAQSSNRGMEPETARAWVVSWERSVTSEFLRAFGKCIAAKPELLPQKEEAQIVLDAYILEKALYELMYELNNRPQWLRIPLTGILAL